MQPFTALNASSTEQAVRAEAPRREPSDRGDHDRFRDAFDRAREHRAEQQAARDRAATDRAAGDRAAADRAADRRRAAAARETDVAAYAREHRGDDDTHGSSSVAGLAVLGRPVAGLVEQHRGSNLEIIGGDGVSQLDVSLEELDDDALAALVGDLGLSAEALLNALQTLEGADTDAVADLAMELAAELLADGAGHDAADVADAAGLMDVLGQLAALTGGDEPLAERIGQLLDAGPDTDLETVLDAVMSVVADSDMDIDVDTDVSLTDELRELAERLAQLLSDDDGLDAAVIRAAAALAELSGALARGSGARASDTDAASDRLEHTVAALRSLAAETDGDGEADPSDEPDMELGQPRASARADQRAATADRAHRGGDSERTRTTSTEARTAPPPAEPPGPPATPPGRAGLGRAPSLPPGVQRVLEAVEQLERLAPPRQLTLDLGELRVRVAMEEGQVRLSVLDGDARDGEELLEDARRALTEQGFDLGGDGEGSGGDTDDDRPSASPDGADERRRAPGRRADTGLRL